MRDTDWHISMTTEGKKKKKKSSSLTQIKQLFKASLLFPRLLSLPLPLASIVILHILPRTLTLPKMVLFR